jgi:hypothetical protein
MSNTDPNNLLGLSSIKDWQKGGVGTLLKHNLKSAWYFETFWEKGILVILSAFGIWRILMFF